MLKAILSSIILTFLLATSIFSQDLTSPYTARTYWEAEQNSTYQAILLKKDKSQIISPAEEQYYEEYFSYLKSFFSKLTPEEQQKYFEFKNQWDEEAIAKLQEKEADVMEINRQGINPGRQFLLSNGLFGLGYGLALNGLLDLYDGDGTAATALPLFTAGFSMAFPFIAAKRYEGITFSTVLLTRHAKLMGAVHGTALGFLVVGNPENNRAKGKFILSSALLGSIAGGEIAFQLGKKNNWSEGRIATNKYYGVYGPWIAFATTVATNANDPRVFGGVVLASGAASYYLGNKIYSRYNFTRGDMLAATSFTLLSTGMGFGFTEVTEPWHLAIPGGMTVLGTVANHHFLRNTKFSSKEGWTINYITGAATIIGLATTILVKPLGHHAYFIVPSAFGLAAWGITASLLNKQGPQHSSSTKKNWTSFSYHMAPQNYFLNKQLKPSGKDPMRPAGLPMFSISVSL